MARKKREEHENHERWLVSYADFITLLFAFFVVMFASSQADAKKVAAVSASIRKAYQGDLDRPGVISRVLGRTEDPSPKKNPGDLTQVPKPSQSPTPPESPAQPPPPSIDDTFSALKLDLAKEIGEDKIHLSVDQRGLIISLEAAAFFPSGEDRIAPEMFPTIEKIATAIGKLDNPIRLEGHTDSMPVRAGRRFPTNWHLSAARAVAVLDLFASKFGIGANRLAVVGYADTKPVATNDTADGRARNRRVDIVVASDGRKDAARAPAKPRPPAPQAASAAAPFWKRWLGL